MAARIPTVNVNAAVAPGAKGPKKVPAEKAPAAPKAAPALKVAPEKKEPKKKVLRAPSAFNLFFKDKFKKVKEEHKLTTLPDVSKVLREQWAALSAEQKKPYEQEAAKAKKEVDAIREKVLAEKKANAKPLTAYMLFSQKNRPAVVKQFPGLPVTEAASKLGALWKALSPAEQQVYKDEAKKQLDAWKAKQPKSDSA